MIKKRNFKNVFFGWWAVIVTGLLSGLSSGFYQRGASVLFKPIASELNLSRAAASVASGVGTLQEGVSFPLAGWLSDKFGPKWVTVFGNVLMSVGFILMYFVNSPWAYYVVWGLILGAGQTLGFTISIDTMITNWFLRRRGLALGVRFAILGGLGALVLPLLGWLLIVHGWRIACLIWAGVVFAGVPLMMYFVKQKRPERYGLLPDGAKVKADSEENKDADNAAGFQETDFTLKQALKTPAFWMLTMAWVAFQIVLRGINVHIIPFLTDMDIDPVVAASMMAIMVFFTIPSRFLSAFLADRVGKNHLKFLMAGTMLLPAAGIAAFLLSQTMGGVYVFFVLYGLGIGAFVPLDIMIRSRYFGRKAYGSIQGFSVIFSAPMAFMSPIYTGWVYDSTGSYISAFILFVALGAAIALAMCLMPVPKLPYTIHQT